MIISVTTLDDRIIHFSSKIFCLIVDNKENSTIVLDLANEVFSYHVSQKEAERILNILSTQMFNDRKIVDDIKSILNT